MASGVRRQGERPDFGVDDDGCPILHVDMDAFFAAVELTRRPELRGRPVIVGGSGRSVVLAATYEAREFGVHSAMPMVQARGLCPQAVVIPPDHGAYRAASAAVMSILWEVTEQVEQISVDEAFLDVSRARRRLGKPTEVATAIRERVRRELGLTCSVGVAATKSVAKLASGMAKPDGMLLVPRAATVEFLHSLPVGALWGVGERTGAQLARWGITTVAQLAATEVGLLQRIVGRAAGAHLHELAWGRDPRAVMPSQPERSLGAETTFERDVTDHDVLQQRLAELCDRVCASLRRRQLLGRTVSLKLRTPDFHTWTRSRTLTAPTDVGQEVYQAARSLLAGSGLQGRPVRLLGVRVEGLLPADGRQLTLEEASAEESSAQRRAEVAVDELRRRFGPAAVRPARSIPPSTTGPAGGVLS